MRFGLYGLLGFALLTSVGCSPAIRFDTDDPSEKPEGPIPDEPGKAYRDPRLEGLSMTGSEIDTLGTIEFDSGSAKINETPRNKGLLEALAAAGNNYKQITKLRVEGHTDSDGDDASNQNLSERRSQAVVDWLVSRGIERHRLLAVGCGERNPLAANDTAANKQQNRRTEFDIEEVEGKRYEVATDACAPNSYRSGYVTLNAPGWDGSGASFTLNKDTYSHREEAKIRYARPMHVPEGQQYWISLVKAGAPDSDIGAWHFVKKGALFDTVEIFKSGEDDFEIRLHDIYPKYPHRVIHRQRIKVTK